MSRRSPRAGSLGVLASIVALGLCGTWFALGDLPFGGGPGEAGDPIAVAVRGWPARPIEGRLSGGFDYAPFDPEVAKRAISSRARVGRELSAVAAATLRGADRDVASPAVGHGSGLQGRLLVLWGHASEAVEVFEGVRLAGRADARTLSDLSAAYLARATEQGDAADLVRALDASASALVLDPSFPEARFNGALALEALYLREAAVDAWERYLEVDPESGWATEARGRIEGLRTSRAPVVPEGGGGVPEAASGDPRESAAHDQLTAAITLYEQYRLGEAADRLAAARSELAALDSPLTPWADYYLALCRYQESDYDGALGWIAQVLDATESDGGSRAEVAGRSLQLAGLICNIEGRYGEGLAAYQEAVRELGKDASRKAWVGVQSSLAESYERLGDQRTAWRHRYAALAEASSLDAPGRVRLYAEPTSAILRAGLPYAARYFADAMVRAAEEAGHPAFSVAAYRRRAEVWQALDESDRALADLERALEESATIGDQTVASITRADILLTRGDLEADLSAGDAMADVSKALEIYRATDNRSGEPRALRARARAHRGLGDLELAQEDLDQALALLEEQHRGVGGVELRGKFFGETRPVFAEMISLALDQGDLPGALVVAERAHDVGGLDLWGGRPEEPSEGELVSLEEVRAKLRSGTALLEYFVLPHRLLVGLVRSEGVWVREVTVGASELDRLVRVFRRRLERGDGREAVREAGARLYERLVGPVRDHLQAGDDLVVIPDGTLHAVPFAALWDVETGNHLIEDHQVLLSPSAAFAVASRPAVQRLPPDGPPRVLVVADPEHDPALSGLDELPGARREARAIESLFPEVTILTGAEATVGRFLEQAPRHQVIHYGGHAIANPSHPLLSFLALAPEAGPGTGALFARDLAERHMDDARLVVLAACRSGDTGGPDGSAGLSSLSRAFLAAGVPTVVGSLWDAKDRPTARLFELFYRELRQGVPAPEALRSAQLAMSSEGDSNAPFTFAWAAFRVEGSITDSAVRQEGERHGR